MTQSNSSPRVYIINKSLTHDYSDAERFGELVFLTEDTYLDIAKVSNICRAFYPWLIESSPDDYIISSSLTTLACAVCSMFSARHKQLNLLIFKGNRYLERHLHFKNGEEE